MADNPFSDSLFDEFDRDTQPSDQILTQNLVNPNDKNQDEQQDVIDQEEELVDENELLGYDDNGFSKTSSTKKQQCILFVV